ncbi:MAG: serine hydrolase domain-containing protein [Ferruginibacter sp.]
MSRIFCPLWSIVASHSCTVYRCAALTILIVFASCNSTPQTSIQLPGTSTLNIVLPVPSRVSPADSIRLHDAAQRWYDSVLGSRGFNGGMIVAKNGSIIFEVYNGSAHLPGTDIIADSTSFHIASVSKTFTAMAILKLSQDGKLGIDDEFSKYFPAFDYPGVTIRTLLSHRSGLPNYIYFMEDLGWDKKTNITNEDVLSFLTTRKAELENIGRPNRGFTYCNTNYALLALLIEKISGKKYSDYLQETFFTPLQMKHTFVYNNSDSGKVVPSYDYRGRIIPVNYLDVVYGDKNIYSTPRDLLTWDRALTSGMIFKPATLSEAYAPYSNEKPGVRNYGLGWRMNIYPTGKKMIYHNGWWHGNNASFIRLTEDSATIIVLGNKYNRGIYHANVLANLFGNYFIQKDDEEIETVKSPEVRKKTRLKPAKVRRDVKAKAKQIVKPKSTPKKQVAKKTKGRKR